MREGCTCRTKQTTPAHLFVSKEHQNKCSQHCKANICSERNQTTPPSIPIRFCSHFSCPKKIPLVDFPAIRLRFAFIFFGNKQIINKQASQQINKHRFAPASQAAEACALQRLSAKNDELCLEAFDEVGGRLLRS